MIAYYRRLPKDHPAYMLPCEASEWSPGDPIPEDWNGRRLSGPRDGIGGSIRNEPPQKGDYFVRGTVEPYRDLVLCTPKAFAFQFARSIDEPDPWQ